MLEATRADPVSSIEGGSGVELNKEANPTPDQRQQRGRRGALLVEHPWKRGHGGIRLYTVPIFTPHVQNAPERKFSPKMLIGEFPGLPGQEPGEGQTLRTGLFIIVVLPFQKPRWRHHLP